MSDRRGDWMQTYSGGCFWVADPRPEEVYLEDIAHALSVMCRFGGHCREFYSVAQHSCLVAQLCGEFALWGLLHDAAEAYLCDLPRPTKVCLRSAGQLLYDEMDAAISNCIYTKFGLRGEIPAVVKHADMVMLATERRDLMTSGLVWASIVDLEPAPFVVKPVGPIEAEAMFLRCFEEFTHGHLAARAAATQDPLAASQSFEQVRSSAPDGGEGASGAGDS